MPIFGIKDPSDTAQLYPAADFCRHNGLRFLALPAVRLAGLPKELAGTALFAQEQCIYLREDSHQAMESVLDTLTPDQPVILLPDSPESLPAFALWVNCWLNRKSSSQELWDVYDENRQLTGRLHPRSAELAEGDYHLVVHVWLRDSLGRYLLTRRSPNKGYGGMWESPGGAAQAGDDSLSACLREMREETGLRLDPTRGRIIKTYREDHFICDVWLFQQDFVLDDVILQPGETCDKRHATRDEILRLHADGDFVPFQFIEDVLRAE